MGLVRVLDAATQQPVEVDDTEASAGLAQGRYAVSGPVRLRRADGAVVEFDGAQASEALARVDRDGRPIFDGLDTDEAAAQRQRQREYGGTTGEIAAAGLGAARGATLGVSDVAAGALGFGEDVAAYQEVNPNASLVGEVGGTLGSLLLPGGAAAGATRGASVGARVLRGVTAPVRGLAMLSEGAGMAATRALAAGEAGLGRRLFARAMGTGVEGAIEGAAGEAAHIMSEEALGQDPDLTAESVLARLGAGALYGGVGGGLLGGSAGLAGETIRGTARLGREGLDALRRGWQQRMGTELAPGVADMLGEGIGRTGALISGVDSDAAAAFTRLSPEGQAARRIVEEGPEATYDVGSRRLGGALDGIFRHLDPILEEAVGSRKLDDVMRVVRRDALPDQITAADGALRRVRELAADIERNIDEYGDGAAAARRRMMQAADGAEMRIQDAVQSGGDSASVAARIFSELDGLKRRVGTARRYSRTRYAREEIDKVYEQELRSVLENEDVWGAGIRGIQAETNAGWHRYLNWDEDFGRQFARAGESQGFDRLRAADSAKVHGFLQQVGAAANDSRAQVFDDWLRGTSELTETIARHYDLPPAARASLEELRAATAAAREAYGEVGNRARVLNQWRAISGGSQSSLAAALSGGAGAAFAVGGGAAALPLGLAAAGVSAISNPARSARMLMTIERLSRQTNVSVGKSVRAFLRGAREVATEGARRGRRAAVASTAAGITSAYRERASRLDEQMRDPASTAERMASSTAELTRGAPRVQQALQMAGARGQQFLAAQRPPSRMLAGQLFAKPSDPPRDAMERWLRQARIVDDPMSVLRSLEARELTAEEVEALRVVYPALYRQVVAAATEAIAEGGKEPSYQDRLQLGLLLGVPTDPSLTPQSLATIQAAYAAASAPTQQSTAPTHRAPDIAGSMASGTQRLEARRAT